MRCRGNWQAADPKALVGLLNTHNASLLEVRKLQAELAQTSPDVPEHAKVRAALRAVSRGVLGDLLKHHPNTVEGTAEHLTKALRKLARAKKPRTARAAIMSLGEPEARVVAKKAAYALEACGRAWPELEKAKVGDTVQCPDCGNVVTLN